MILVVRVEGSGGGLWIRGRYVGWASYGSELLERVDWGLEDIWGALKERVDY